MKIVKNDSKIIIVLHLSKSVKQTVKDNAAENDYQKSNYVIRKARDYLTMLIILTVIITVITFFYKSLLFPLFIYISACYC